MLQALLLATSIIIGSDSLAQVVPADTVWVTVQGKTYHREPKPGMGIHNQHGRVSAQGDTVVFWVHRADAEVSGLTPCRFCFPPRRAITVGSTPAAKAMNLRKEREQAVVDEKKDTKKKK